MSNWEFSSLLAQCWKKKKKFRTSYITTNPQTNLSCHSLYLTPVTDRDTTNTFIILLFLLKWTGLIWQEWDLGFFSFLFLLYKLPWTSTSSILAKYVAETFWSLPQHKGADAEQGQWQPCKSPKLLPYDLIL